MSMVHTSLRSYKMVMTPATYGVRYLFDGWHERGGFTSRIAAEDFIHTKTNASIWCVYHIMPDGRWVSLH